LPPSNIDFSKIPSNYIICSLHFNSALQEIYVNRHSGQDNSFSIRLPTNRKYSRDGDRTSVDFQTFFDEWSEIMELNRSSTSSLKSDDPEEKTEWWKNRKALDERIKSLLETMERFIFGGFKGIFTFPANESRLDSRKMTQLQIEIGKILDCCVSRSNKVHYKATDILHTSIIDIIFELNECEMKNDDLEDIFYFLIECYQNYGVQMVLDEMNIDSVLIFINLADDF
jgi:separase